MPEEKAKKEEKKANKSSLSGKRDKYIYGLGRRKNAVAQVRLYEKGKGEVVVNGKEYKEYFPTFLLQTIIFQPFETLGEKNFDVSIKVKGGGKRGQAEASRHGIARALVKLSEDFKKPLKRKGFLTRDPRVKERKKYGLKGARRAPQWQKR